MIDPQFYDLELRAHHQHLRGAYGIAPGMEVLDIGCGAGLTTREAGRAAAPGSVLGVDVSEQMLHSARELTAREGLKNVTYTHDDAQVCRFDPERFDVAVSRFGTMFFPDPVAAFGNVASALRRQGRIAWLVWQPRERNEWSLAIDAAVGGAPPPAAADPFSLGDPAATTDALERAGFEAVRFDDVHEPVLYGDDIDAALGVVRSFHNVAVALADMSDEDAHQAVSRLRRALEAHHAAEHGIAFDARSWLITARRR